MLRRMRLLVPVVLLVVLWSSLVSTPRPGANPVGWMLAAFVVASVGVVATLPWQGGWLNVTCAIGVLVTSAALTQLQGGAAVPGIFVGITLLMYRLRRPVWLVPAVMAVVLIATLIAASRHISFETALLNVIMFGAFYGMMFLAVRLGEANRHAEQLLAELEASRDAQARAASWPSGSASPGRCMMCSPIRCPG